MKLFLLTLFYAGLTYSGTQSFEGVVKYEGQVVHFERHKLTYVGADLTSAQIDYVDTEGHLLARMTSSFTPHGNLPEYLFEDYRSDTLQGLRWLGNTVEVFSRGIGQKKIHRKNLGILSDKENFIAGPGLLYFIKKNLNKIISENGVTIKFIRPGSFKAYEYFLIPLKHSNKTAEFELRVKAWWMHLFSPRLKIVYELPSRRLSSYEGFTNLRDREGNFISVDIQYIYEN